MSKVGRWSTTANNNNATPPDGWPEGQAPSTVNDCAREMMAQIRTMLNDMSFIDLDHSPTQTSSTTFTIPGNVVSFYDYGRRVKAFDATTLYGTVISSSFTTNTGITLRLDSGLLTSSLTSVAVSVLGSQNNALPDNVYRTKNAILNGQLNIWQRGAGPFAVNGSAVSAVTADRFTLNNNSSASINASRAERSANASNVPTLAQTGLFITNSLVISVSAVDAAIGASDYAYLAYTMEGYDWRQIAHKPLTCSFWVNSNRTGTYCLTMRNGSIDRCAVFEYSISAISTWEKKVFTIPEPPTAGTWDYSTGAGLFVNFVLAAGSSKQITNAGAWTAQSALATSNQTNFLASAGHTIKFADFRLYEGVGERPINIETIEDEYSRCQRYYNRIEDTAGGLGYLGMAASTTDGYFQFEFPVTMRTTPTISANVADGAAVFAVANTGGATISVSAIGSTKITPSRAIILFRQVAAGNLTSGTGVWLSIASGGYIELTAEMGS